MDAAGLVLTVVTIAAKIGFKIRDISSDYKSAYPELTRVESSLNHLNSVLGGLQHGNDVVLESVLKDLGDYLNEVEAFIDIKVKKLAKKPVLVKLLWHKDHAAYERMEAVLETYKSTLVIALQVQSKKDKDVDRTELVKELKASLEQTRSQATEFELGSQKIRDIRVYLESVAKKVEEKAVVGVVSGEVITSATELGTGEPMKTWPTFEAWMDSFTPSGEDTERDAEFLAMNGQKVKKGEVKELRNITPSTDPGLESGMETARLCIVDLSKEPGKPTRRLITVSPHDEVADVLETLHEEGFKWITGFAVGEGDKAPLIGPIVSQSAKFIVTTTAGISSYDHSTDYAVHMDETLISFFNRTLMARRPERKEITIKHTLDDIRVKDNYRNICDATLSVKLLRTVRIPDNNQVHNLPQDFGPFPIFDIEDFKDTLPPGMKEQGGVFIPMLLREALYMSLVSSRGPIEKPTSWGRSWHSEEDKGKDPVDELFAVRFFAGRANVVSGSDPLGKIPTKVQDYIIAPKQDRLDGFCMEEGKSGTVRQFNATSLGSGYAVEAQVSGREAGGIQLQFAPRYKRNVEFYVFDTEGQLGARVDMTATPRELGLRPGTPLVMAPLSDPNFKPPRWTLKYPRPDRFDGWGFRHGNWKANKGRSLDLLREGASPSPSSDAKGEFPSDVHGVAYEEKRPQTQQPKPERHLVWHPELARPTKISDLFAAAGVSFKVPLQIRPVPPITVKFEIEFSEEVRKEVGSMPKEMILDITASQFEDVISFRQRAKAAIFKEAGTMMHTSNKYSRHISLKVRCNGPQRWQFEDLHGKVYPCYMPLHELEISRTLLGKAWVVVRRPKKLPGRGMRIGMGAGGVMRQEILEDKFPRMWNWDAAQTINIQILNSVAFKSATGMDPPIPAISFEEYTRVGLPLLSYYCEGKDEISRPLALSEAWIQSIGQIDQERGLRLGVRVRKDNGAVICVSCEHRLCDSILLPCRHIFCNFCIKLHMTTRKSVTCTLCNSSAPTVKLFASAATVDSRFSIKNPQNSTPGVISTPVAKMEALCSSRVGWGGESNTPEYVPVLKRVLNGFTQSHKVGDADWNMMLAQVVREWEMGLRSEEGVKDLATYALTAAQGVKEGTPEGVELLLRLGARPGNEEQREKLMKMAGERGDFGAMEWRLKEEGWGE